MSVYVYPYIQYSNYYVLLTHRFTIFICVIRRKAMKQMKMRSMRLRRQQRRKRVATRRRRMSSERSAFRPRPSFFSLFYELVELSLIRVSALCVHLLLFLHGTEWLSLLVLYGVNSWHIHECNLIISLNSYSFILAQFALFIIDDIKTPLSAFDFRL